ncbi:MAG: TolC family protein [Brotaphodocola sp.]
MKRIKRWQKTAALTGVGMSLLGMAVLQAPMQVLAGTPEFARSEEEWARLRDDVIEYDELSGLVHEYNATVKKNQIDLNQFRKDYGESNDEWADRYRELADDLESSLNYPDVDDANYAAVMSSIVTSEMQIDAWRETADDALEDYLTYYYDTNLAECMLVSQAQQNIISLYTGQIQQKTDEKTLELLQEQFNSIQNQLSLGLATDAEMLSVRESVRNAEKAVQDDKDSLKNLYERTIVMLGWRHDATPEIAEIPDSAFEQYQERIASMNPDEDKAMAVENSYKMKSNKRKMENSLSSDAKENLEETIREDEQSIGAALVSAYQNVLACEASYDLNVALAELEQDNLRRANLKYEIGKISRLDRLNQEITTTQAEGKVESARLQLFQAVENYDWMLHGLAGSSAS